MYYPTNSKKKEEEPFAASGGMNLDSQSTESNIACLVIYELNVFFRSHLKGLHQILI